MNQNTIAPVRSPKPPVVRARTAGLLGLALCACAGGPEGRGASLRAVARLDPPQVLVEPSPLADEELRLDRLLAFALEHNPGLGALRERAAAAAERPGHVGARPDPVVTFGWYAVPVRTRNGDQEWGLGIRQQLPWGPELAGRVEVAEREADLAALEVRAAEADLVRELVVAFHELTYLHRAGALLDAKARGLSELELIAAGGLADGRAGLAAQVRAGDLAAQLEYDRVVLAERIAVERAALAALCGTDDVDARGADGDGSPPAAIAIPELTAPLETLQALAVRTSPDLELAAARVQRAHAELERAGELRKPQLMLGARTILNDELRGPVPDNGDDPVLFELGLSLPVHGAAADHLRRESRHRLRATVLERDAREDRLRADLARAWWKVRSDRRLADLYRADLLPQAERSLAAARALFEQGEAGFESLLEAFRAHQTHALGALRAEADHARAVAELERLVGAPLELVPADAEPALSAEHALPTEPGEARGGER